MGDAAKVVARNSNPKTSDVSNPRRQPKLALVVKARFPFQKSLASRPILEEETAKEEEIANWEEEANKRMTMTVVNKTRIRTIMQVGSSFSSKEDIMNFISCMRCVIREGMVLWLCRGAWNELVYIVNSSHISLGESSVRSRTFTLFYFIFSL